MIALETFTFTAQGFTCHVEAVNPVQAYDAANQRLRERGFDLPQGVWMETATPRAYRWAEGNFFD